MATRLKAESEVLGKYEPRKFDHLFGMKGFSDKLLSDHFKLYQGYVTNTNTALEKIDFLSKDEEANKLAMSEIRRRVGWEMNGMWLHEYYFGNLGGHGPIHEPSELYKAMKAQYGDYRKWQSDFIAAGAMRGIGWVVLYQDVKSNRLLNMWIEEHNVNHLIGANPILVMDVYEHAFMTDYGTDKIKYIHAFFQNIDWNIVERRMV